MDWMSMKIAWMMFVDWWKETFGSGVHFPTAPDYQEGWVK